MSKKILGEDSRQAYDYARANKRPSKRVKAAELINAETRFDAEKYVDMVILAGANILSPFGYTEERLKDEICYGEKQTVLKFTQTIT